MPELLILRHAIALDREEAASLGLSDAERPLTEKGQRRMEQVAAGLRRLIEPPALILSSPLQRARQTADILAAQYDSLAVDIIAELAPGSSFPQLIKTLKQQQVAGPLVVVGHEPDLSQLTGLLLCNREATFVQLKKGGAVLLNFEQRIDRGQGMMQWLLPPRLLRKYGQEI